MNEESNVQQPMTAQAPATQQPQPKGTCCGAPAPRKVRRVGTFTMGICLVVAGIALVINMFRPGWNMLYLFRLAPLVLVALGAELLVASATKGDTKLKYDFLSAVLCVFLLAAGFIGAAGVKLTEYISPENIRNLEQIQAQWDEAVGTALAKDTNVENVETYVNYSFSWPEHVVMPASLSELGQDATASVTLAGEFQDVQAFLQAAQPVVQAVEACGVQNPDIYLVADGPNQTQYSLDIHGTFAHKKAVTELGSLVTVQQWVEDAGCYMTQDEAKHWQVEQSTADREAELSAKEQELAVREEELVAKEGELETWEDELSAREEALQSQTA